LVAREVLGLLLLVLFGEDGFEGAMDSDADTFGIALEDEKTVAVEAVVNTVDDTIGDDCVKEKAGIAEETVDTVDETFDGNSADLRTCSGIAFGRDWAGGPHQEKVGMDEVWGAETAEELVGVGGVKGSASMLSDKVDGASFADTVG
jgi:hypothetical protein